MKTTIYLDDEKVAVNFDGGEYIINKQDNAWLWVIGAIHDKTPIYIIDQRKKLEDHQYNLSCVENIQPK